MQQWQGPLPPPGALAQFNQIIPNGAERIFAMVEHEQTARIAHEAKSLDAAVIDGRVRRWQGFGLSVLCVVASVYSVYLGAHPTVSVALVGLPIAAAVKAIIGRS